MVYCIQVSALISGLIGTILLAFSLNSIVSALSNAFTAMDITIDSILGGGDIAQFKGMDRHITRAKKNSKWMTWLGLSFLIGSIALQYVAINPTIFGITN